jgi:hypothetical protein
MRDLLAARAAVATKSLSSSFKLGDDALEKYDMS